MPRDQKHETRGMKPFALQKQAMGVRRMYSVQEGGSRPRCVFQGQGCNAREDPSRPPQGLMVCVIRRTTSANPRMIRYQTKTIVVLVAR